MLSLLTALSLPFNSFSILHCVGVRSICRVLELLVERSDTGGYNYRFANANPLAVHHHTVSQRCLHFISPSVKYYELELDKGTHYSCITTVDPMLALGSLKLSPLKENIPTLIIPAANPTKAEGEVRTQPFPIPPGKGRSSSLPLLFHRDLVQC